MLTSGWSSGRLLCVGQSPQSKNPSPLLDAAGHVRQDAYVSLPVPAADKIYEKIDGRRIKEKILEVVAISRQAATLATDTAGASQAAGTRAGAPVVRAGLERHRDRRRQDAIVQVAEYRSWLRAHAAGRSGSRGDLGGIGHGGRFHGPGRDVRGKAVLILSILEPGNMGESAGWEGAWKRAADLGAAAIFTI